MLLDESAAPVSNLPQLAARERRELTQRLFDDVHRAVDEGHLIGP